MERRALGRSGLEVPVVGMGTWRTFDVRGREAESSRARIVDAALAAGANLFDSSPMYGEAERVLGGSLEQRRDAAIVATKVWTASPEEGRGQIERALRWFGGRVDIYQIHNLVAWKDWLPVLEAMRDQGTVRVIGATHHRHAAFGELRTVMETGGITQIQIPYNAVDHEVEREILPIAADLGIGVLVMRPLGEGTLVRRAPTAEQLRPLESFGITTWAQALLKWCLSDRRVHAVIPATSKAHRMTENAVAGCPPWLDAEARSYVVKLARSLSS